MTNYPTISAIFIKKSGICNFNTKGTQKEPKRPTKSITIKTVEKIESLNKKKPNFSESKKKPVVNMTSSNRFQMLSL